MFNKIDVLKGFVEITEMNLYWRLFFNKNVGLACNFITKETPAQVQNF